MKRTYILVLLCLLGFSAANAQQIIEAEYFFDTDPGVGNGINIPMTPGSSIDETTTVDISTLGMGYHYLLVRVKDENGVWSVGKFKTIYIQPEANTGQIIAAEYFFDNDPGIGNGTTIQFSGTDNLDEIQNIMIPGNLENGPHRMFIRTQSTDSLWSHYSDHYFEVCDFYGPLAGFDYSLSPDRWVSITDQSENATSHLWDFDDGSTDTVASPTHHFATAGIYKVKHYAINGCGIDTVEKTIEIRGIYSVNSNKGSNSGSITVLISGFGFNGNAIPSFTRAGYAPILPDTFNIQEGNIIQARFDLRGQEAGLWNVNVEIPGDTTFVKSGGFKILENPDPDLVITVNGRQKFLVNRYYYYNITVRNNGYEDVVGLPLVIKNLEEFISLDIDEIDKPDIWADAFYSDLTSYVQSNNIDSSYIDYDFIDESISRHGAAFVIPYIPAGRKLDFIIRIKSSEDGLLHPQYRIGTRGYIASTSLLEGEPVSTPLNCRSGEFRGALEMALDTSFEQSVWDNCFDAANQSALEHLRSVAMSNQAGNQLLSYQGFNGVMLHNIVSCLLPGSLDANIFIDVMTLLNERFNTLDLLIENEGECGLILFSNLFNNMDWKEKISENTYTENSDYNNQIFNPSLKSMGGGDGNTIKWAQVAGSLADPELWAALSMDPNEKSGPPGYYLNDKQTMSYSIHFENVESASAAAGMVRIIDTLDASRFDLSSMRFESFGYNTSFFNGIQENNKLLAVIDLRPERPVYLKMEAFIDTVSGHTEWVFESLDTLTLQLTDDPDAGFLLPNVNHPEGEGFVNFSIDLIDNITSGDLIENKAQIIFDNNEAIDTEYWTNVFEDGIPSSEVLDLPDTLFAETITINWEGNDDVSGIRFYDVYVASILDTDTTITFWRYHTSETTGEFTGEFGEKYYFYSVATDNAGNSESNAVAFDTEVQLSEVITEIDRISDLEFVNVYPNPTPGIVNLQNIPIGDVIIEVYSTTGKQVFQLRTGNESETINLDQFGKGLYHIRISKGNQTLNKKIIVN